MWLYSERKDDVIWSDLKLGSQLELNAILFQSWSKIRSNSKLPSIIVMLLYAQYCPGCFIKTETLFHFQFFFPIVNGKLWLAVQA